jgi:hypothetical protein
MQDFLRDDDPLSRTERRRVRASATALSAAGYGIPPATVNDFAWQSREVAVELHVIREWRYNILAEPASRLSRQLSDFDLQQTAAGQPDR